MLNRESEQFGLLDVLTVMSLMLQINDHDRDVKQLSNDDLMKELQRQDREYLERIIRNQEQIIDSQNRILKGIERLNINSPV